MSAVFIHLKSESCDDYYYTFDGPLSEEEAVAKAHDLCPEDPEYLYVHAIERWPEDLGKVKGP